MCPRVRWQRGGYIDNIKEIGKIAEELYVAMQDMPFSDMISMAWEGAKLIPDVMGSMVTSLPSALDNMASELQEDLRYVTQNSDLALLAGIIKGEISVYEAAYRQGKAKGITIDLFIQYGVARGGGKAFSWAIRTLPTPLRKALWKWFNGPKRLGTAEAAKGGLQYSDDLLKAAQQAYPKLAGKTQLHHITPKYLGGPANGPLIKLDAAYHQQITNAFRKLHPYNLPKPNAAELEILKNKVYSQFPLPKYLF